MKKYLSYLFFSILMVALLFFSSNKNFAHAEIPSSGQIVVSINSEEALKAISTDLSGNYKLTSDIYLTQPWQVLGEFSGQLNGDGYKIYNLSIGANNFNNGLFSKCTNAKIINLGLENVSISLIDVEAEGENSSIFVGAFAGVMENTIVENCYANFKQNDYSNLPLLELENVPNQISASTVINFGGIAGKAQNGCEIKNTFSNVHTIITQKGSLLGEFNVGGLFGSVYSCSLSNVYSVGQIRANIVKDSNIDSDNVVSVGGIAGFVSGNNASIINSYFSGEIVAEGNVGAIVGKINYSSLPKTGNINYCVFFNQNDCVGLNNGYNVQNSSKLSEKNTSVFLSDVWSSLYPWNFDSVWTSHLNTEPTLQKFNTYNLSLDKNLTIVDFGEGVDSTGFGVIKISFENEIELKTKQFRYGDLVSVYLQINDDFLPYYNLESVMVDGSIVATLDSVKQGYNLSKTENEYVFSFEIKDSLQGQISVALEKISHNAVIKSSNSIAGKIRNQFSVSTYESIDLTLSNGNMYKLFAVPTGNDYVFENWTIEFGEGDDKESYILENFTSSQLGFRFGLSGQQHEVELTEFLLEGGTICANFTNNTVVYSISTTLTKGETEKTIAKIYYELDGERFEHSQDFKIQKDKEFVLIAEPEEGFTFDGWYSNGSKLSSETSYTLVASSVEDVQNIEARFIDDNAGFGLRTLWIILGVVGGLLAVGGIVWLIIAKKRDSSYKNYY